MVTVLTQLGATIWHTYLHFDVTMLHFCSFAWSGTTFPSVPIPVTTLPSAPISVTTLPSALISVTILVPSVPNLVHYGILYPCLYPIRHIITDL